MERFVFGLGLTIAILISLDGVDGGVFNEKSLSLRVKPSRDDDRKSDNLIWRQTRSLSGDPKWTVINRPKFQVVEDSVEDKNGDTLLRDKRSVHPASEILGTNFLNGVDLSNPEYLPDHHHGRRRVKKVLESDMYYEKQYNEPDMSVIARKKRFVLPFNFSPLLAMKFLLSSGKVIANSAIANGGNNAQEINSSKNKEIRENGIVKINSGASRPFEISRDNKEFSGIELKTFHDAILSTIPGFCPEVKAEHQITLQTLKRVVANEIDTKLPNNRNPADQISITIAPLIQKIKECASAGSPEIDSNSGARTTRKTKRDEFQWFGKIGKDRWNILAFESLVLRLLNQKCKKLDDQDEAEIRLIAGRLFSVIQGIGLKQLTPSSVPNLEDMMGLVEVVQDCFMGDYPTYLDALENNS